MSKEIFYADTRMGTLRHADPNFNFKQWFGDIILARTLADFYEYEADCSRNQYGQMLRELEDEVTPYIDINDIEDYDESKDYTWDKEAREMPRDEWFELCEEALLKSQSTRDGRSYASAGFEELTDAEKFRDSVEWTVLCTLGSTYGKDVRNKYVRYKKLKEQYEDLLAEVERLRGGLIAIQRSLIWDGEDRAMDGEPITLEALVAQVEQVRSDITEMIE